MKLKFDIFWQTLHYKQKFLTILLPLYPSDAYNQQATITEDLLTTLSCSSIS